MRKYFHQISSSSSIYCQKNAIVVFPWVGKFCKQVALSSDCTQTSISLSAHFTIIFPVCDIWKAARYLPSTAEKKIIIPCLNLNRSRIAFFLSFFSSFVRSVSLNQCDQIWRNFTTLAKSLGQFFRVYLVFGKILIVLCQNVLLLGKLSLL